MGCGACSGAKKYQKADDAVTPLGWSPSRRCSGSAYVIIRNKQPINQVYDLQKDPISKGAFSKVRLGTHRESFLMRAIKCLPRPRLQKRNQVGGADANTTTDEDFENEVKILGRMDHPNIVRAFETFQDSINHYLVMEYCSGGAILDVLSTLEEFTERQAGVVMQQVLRGIGYMHKLSIVHRDVRPSNLLLSKQCQVKDSIIKICDLGSACFDDDGVRMKQRVGALYYNAPEMDSTHNYTEKVDVWSCGVATFTLLCGYPTLQSGASKKEMLQAAQGAFMWTKKDWQVCSKSAQSLLDQMLETDPEARCTIEDAQKHEWIKRQGGGYMDTPVGVHHFKSLREHTIVSNVKKRAEKVVAQRLDAQRIRQLQDTLRAMDRSENGILTLSELSKALAEMGHVHEDITEMVADLKASAAKMPFDYTDFIAMTMQQRQINSEVICHEAFESLDADHEGVIQRRDVKKVVMYLADRIQMSQAEIDAVLNLNEKRKVEPDRDPGVDFESLMDMVRAV